MLDVEAWRMSVCVRERGEPSHASQSHFILSSHLSLIHIPTAPLLFLSHLRK